MKSDWICILHKVWKGPPNIKRDAIFCVCFDHSKNASEFNWDEKRTLVKCVEIQYWF